MVLTSLDVTSRSLTVSEEEEEELDSTKAVSLELIFSKWDFCR